MKSLLVIVSMLALLNAAPAGTYSGTSNILGINLVGSVTVNGDTMDINMKSTGLLEINMVCNGEAFTMSGSNVNLSGVGTSGNCVHDELSSEGISL